MSDLTIKVANVFKPYSKPLQSNFTAVIDPLM